LLAKTEEVHPRDLDSDWWVMTRHVDKIIVTNRGAMIAKYGTGGWHSVRDAVRALISADEARGLSSRLVMLDSRSHGHVAPVGDVSDAAATKAAVDAIAVASTPLYLMILGAPDVVAQPILTNPTQDDDVTVPSDLPYACSAPAGSDPGDFIGPSRVVGRLPDLPGAIDPGDLVALLARAAAWTARPASELLPVFGVSAEVWQGSTRQSIQHLPGTGTSVHLVPPEGRVWTSSAFGARLHFVNCHGGDTDPAWYGQHGTSYPVALDAALVEPLVAEGTVVAAECCYGTRHYDPNDAGGQQGVAMSYLAGGAAGVFGSSTEAYGPANAMGSADLLARYFLSSVLEGASLGRAALEARLRFVQEAGELDPIDLKTVAQFDLLGDPSIHPALAPQSAPQPKRVRAGARRAAPLDPGRSAARRTTLAAMGDAVERSVARVDPRPRRSGISAARVAEVSGISGRRLGPVRTYVANSRAAGAPNVRYHVASEPVGRGRRTVVVRDSAGRLSARVVLSR
jgi:hypothetical protein